MGRWEVGTRGTERARVPDHVCAGCGARKGQVPWSEEKLHLPLAHPRTVNLPQYDFPLCAECGAAKDVRDRFLVIGGALGAFGVLAGAVALAVRRGGDHSAGGLQAVVTLIVFTLVGASAGMGLGWLISQAAGAFSPLVARGNRVARAVDYSFESWSPGKAISDYRCLFRFTSEAFAREFTRVNEPILMSVREGRARALS